MQSMFKTVNIQESTNENNLQNSVANQPDYNTLQSLFATQKLNLSQVPQAPQENSEALSDIGNINMSDYNTMQNLFKTNAASLSKTTNPQSENNSNNLL